LDDYNRTEKISDLPKKLTIRGAADGVEPAAGDIAYYPPWGNLAIFYKDFNYSRGLVKLGAIESSAMAFKRPEACVRRSNQSTNEPVVPWLGSSSPVVQTGWVALAAQRKPRQNMLFEFADVSGIRWSTSQCSTIFPASSSRKMSMPAQSASPGHR
jgi:hypothetical protein